MQDVIKVNRSIANVKDRIYLVTSKQNLKAAKVLYDAKLYPEALFFLQQATEKVIKSLGYHFRTIEFRDNIAHRAWEVFLIWIIQYDPKNGMKFSSIFYGSLAWKYLKNTYGISRIEELQDLLEKGKIRKIVLPDTMLDEFVAQYSEFGVRLQFIDKFEEKTFLEKLANVLIEAGTSIADFAVKTILFMTFSLDASLLLYDLAEKTRYGDETDPASIFTDQNLFVQKFNDLAHIIEHVQYGAGFFVT